MRELNDQTLKALRGHDPVRDEDVDLIARADVFAELFTHIVSAPPDELESPPAPLSRVTEHASARQVHRRFHYLRFAVSGLTVAALVTVLLVGQSLGWFGGSPSNVTTGRVGSSAWRLMSDVTSAWQVADGAGLNPNFRLICPTTTTCYAFQPPQWSSSAGGALGAVQVTRDGGATWEPLVLPVTFASSPTMSCVGSSVCALVGVTQAGTSAFLETVDGGSTWSSQTGPRLSAWSDMSCASSSNCLVVSSGGPRAVGGPFTAFVTDDGGASWTENQLPSNDFYPNPDVDCFSVGSCVIGGLAWPPTPTSGDFSAGMIVYTTNDGASWAEATTPPGLGEVSSVSCTADGQCVATADQGIETGAELISSSDGGTTWSQLTASGLSDDFGMGVTCPTSSTCWAVGASATPAPDTAPGSAPGEYELTDVTGLVAYTTDGGQTWQSAVLPSNVRDVFNVSCPNATTCFALAIDESTPSGSPGTPYVLTNSQ